MKKTLMAAGLVMTVAAPALANPNCLQIGLVYNWHVVDSKTLIVEDELHQKFKLTLMGYCPALPYNETLGFRVIGGNSQLACISKGDQIISREHPLGAFRCPITNIIPYTPEMEKADKAAAAAKAAQKGGAP